MTGDAPGRALRGVVLSGRRRCSAAAEGVQTRSAGTTARLNRARHAALSAAPAPRRGWAWPLAAGCTALLALAAGLQISAPPASDPASAQAVASAPLTLAEDAMLDDAAADAYVAYDESPDFYLWLAANEATLLAVE